MKDEIWIDYQEDEYTSLLPQEEILDWIEKLMIELSKQDCNLSVSFVDNEAIKELNRSYRNKEKETDVLSFSQMEGEQFDFDNRFLGDIVISVPFAAEQAKQLEHSVLEEVKYLLLHGMLHLLGYDHDEEEVGEMSLLEKKIYQKLTGDAVE